jgi:PAS domain S-box-containing protein
MPIRLGILPKLVIAFVLFAAALMLVTGVASYNSGRSALQAATISDLLSTATEKEAALKTWVSDRQSDVASIIKPPDFIDKVTSLALAEPGSPVAQDFHDQVRAELQPHAGPSLEFLELDLLDPQNGEVLVSTATGEEGKFKEDRPYFTNGKKGPYVQNLYFSTTIQAPAMTAAAPVFDPAGKLIGVLAGHLNLDEMNAIVNRRTGQFQTSDAFLVNTSNLPVTQPRFIPDQAVLQRGLRTEAINRCLQRTSGVIMANDYRGIPAVIVYRWLSDQELCLIVKVDQAEAFAPSLAFGRTILIISSLALLAGALLAYGLAGAISRPVQQLVSGAAAIGQGNLDVRIPSKSQDEIGQLAQAFNAMAASLQASIAALRQSENQLQLVYDTVSDAIYVLQPEQEHSYRFISVNHQFLTIAGLPEDQVIGLPVNQVIPEPACSLALEKFAQAIHEKHTVAWEETSLYPGGEHIGDVSVTPLFDASGACTQLIASVHDITARKQAELALERSINELKALNATAAIVTQSLDVQEILNQLLAAPLRFTGVKAVAFQLLDQKTGELAMEAHHGLSAGFVQAFSRMKTDEGIEGKAVQTGKALAINSLTEYPDARRVYLENEHIQSAAAIPLTGSQGVIGVMSVGAGSPDYFDAATVELLTTMGQQIAIGIEKARLYQQTRAWAAELEQRVAERTRALQESEALYRTLAEELHHSRQMLQIVLDTVPQRVFWKDLELTYLGCNRVFAQDVGLGDPAAVVGKNDYQLLKGAYAGLYRKDDMDVIQSGKAKLNYEEPQSLLDGSPIWLRTNKVPLYDLSGSVIGVLGTYEDITQSKQAEQALVESEERFRSAFEQAAVGISHTALDGRFLRVNQRNCEMLGYSQEEMLGLTFQQITHPDDLNVELNQLNALLAGQTRTYSIEKRYIRKDHSLVWVNRTVGLVREPTGEPKYLIAVAEDISARKQAQEELKKTAAELVRSNAELERFAYVASHDLQEPLRMVTSYLQLLEQRYRDRLDGAAIEFIDFAVDGAARMKTLINDLLAFSRLSTHGETFAPTNCETVLERVLADLRLSIVENGARVTHDPLPTLQADPSQMERVFQNLIGNAIKFHGDQPPAIHIGAQRQPGEWLFSVRDNGIGIDPKYFERIFLIFQRLHTRDKYPGTGIGLAISQRIIQRHGGRIWVESRPGQGSIFYFTLPIPGDDEHDSP